MIVQPDFCDHWKTRHVVRKTGSEATVRCILRLWGHCQQRRRWVFPDLTAEVLASICGWEGEPAALWDAMVGAFLDVTDAGIEVHDWAEANASLISNWQKGQYGSQGGRPRKNPGGFPRVNGENPGLILSKPDKRREDKIREEGILEAKASSPHQGGEIRSISTENKAERQASGGEAATLVEAWNGTGLRGVVRLTDGRRKAANARLAEPFFREHYPEGLKLVQQSKFCAGVNDRNWRANFDWFLRPDTLPKILEGTYTDTKPKRDPVTGRPTR